MQLLRRRNRTWHWQELCTPRRQSTKILWKQVPDQRSRAPPRSTKMEVDRGLEY